ncbi:NosD domain-containing protein [Flavobacterium granuli]|uniref:Parallel beta-helix repeat (Two copies) n=1 Tax=Flavobacterium granuli TaxID=280093 RepID=A0A1M5JTP4_9FLAO|nr:NosD domain-containing protein [Flavobacterium granuli]PRZ26053.1 parallel beta-helix repeat protein [Flavobacterium granuli]SHG43785.1 parallel beta-helix repeat (two copies) [Flavobacterium granuli]
MKYINQIFTITVLTLFFATASVAKTPLTKGMRITKSTTIKEGVYFIEAESSLSSPVIVVEGNNITIDFNGAELCGSNNKAFPDEFKGLAILIKGNNVTLKNAVIKGYKVAVMAQNSDALKLSNNDFSYNFRQHLKSTREREDYSDWQSYHNNEKDEWLRFGAGIYLSNCNRATIFNNTISNGQCGLMMSSCNDAIIYNNNFSFNTGIGIGFYRSSKNKVMHNKVDWNVRGMSDGFYYRGQDSAGILIFQQCNNNVFAYNSVTHSGDGFFMWPGKTTLDNGTGGCNDNLLYGNDFSFAPTNGVEITFSRNNVVNNIMHGCWHGIWGGYSYETNIIGNDFADNMEGIAIEHGQNNRISQNRFQREGLAINLWASEKIDTTLGYNKNRDVHSMDYQITKNSFEHSKNVFSIRNTKRLNIADNYFLGNAKLMNADVGVEKMNFFNNDLIASPVQDAATILSYAPKPIAEGMNTMLPKGFPKGRKAMMMTEWGPYNFSYPMIWWTKTDSDGKIYFDVMGPKGNWKLKKAKGVKIISENKGSIPAQMIVQKEDSSEAITDILIDLEYTGEKFISEFGEMHSEGKPVVFSYKKFELHTPWELKWYKINDTNDPIKQPEAYQKLLQQKPIKTGVFKELQTDLWKNDKTYKDLSTENYVEIATTKVSTPNEENYTLGISVAYAVKVYVDDKMVINIDDLSQLVYDADYYHEAKIRLTKGTHTIRIERMQYGNYDLLNFYFAPTQKK